MMWMMWMECQKLRNQNVMNNEKKIMDKKVRIIFFILLSLCVWIVGQIGFGIYNLFSNFI